MINELVEDLMSAGFEELKLPGTGWLEAVH